MTEPFWIEERETLALHGRLLALDGGLPGIRDGGLPQSALARPRQHHAYAGPADIIHLAAIYTAAIIRNHPFVDGNKRTGFVIGILFLEGATQAVLALAAGTLNEDGYTAFLVANAASL